MEYDFWFILSMIFAVLFWARFFANLGGHLSYNSPDNFKRKMDLAMYGRKRQFNVQGNLWIAIICSVYAYCRYHGGI